MGVGGANAVISFMVHLVRIATYIGLLFLLRDSDPTGGLQWPLVLADTGAAFLGVLLGKRYMRKITMKTVQTLTGILLLGIALVLGAGII